MKTIARSPAGYSWWNTPPNPSKLSSTWSTYSCWASAYAKTSASVSFQCCILMRSHKISRLTSGVCREKKNGYPTPFEGLWFSTNYDFACYFEWEFGACFLSSICSLFWILVIAFFQDFRTTKIFFPNAPLLRKHVCETCWDIVTTSTA